MSQIVTYEYSLKNTIPLDHSIIIAQNVQSDLFYFVRKKDNYTWEIPGGRKESNESISDCAHRELEEEILATDYFMTPLCLYKQELDDSMQRYGAIFFAKVFDCSNSAPILEIAEIRQLSTPPKNLTYPQITSFAHHFAKISGVQEQIDSFLNKTAPFFSIFSNISMNRDIFIKKSNCQFKYNCSCRKNKY